MRISGVTIPDKKKIEFALAYIYGVGISSAKEIVKKAKINPETRAEALSQDEINRLREILEKGFRIEGDLRRDVMMNIKRLKDVGTYRGIRHMRGLPVRGQRTKTNSRTRRGNVRKTMGSGRKPATSPT